MENATSSDGKTKKMATGDIISKRFTISQETYKAIKIKAIELELDKDGKVNGIPYTKEDGEFGYPLPDDRYTTGITVKPLSQDEDYEIDAVVVSQPDR